MNRLSATVADGSSPRPAAAGFGDGRTVTGVGNPHGCRPFDPTCCDGLTARSADTLGARASRPLGQLWACGPLAGGTPALPGTHR